jgi:dipeptidyl aminopeptidase/acylaminoacyl peptidase
MLADTAAAFLEPNLVVFVQHGSLVARRLDLAGGELRGDPITLAESVSNDLGFRLGAFSVSASGHVAYRSNIADPSQLSWFDRTGKPLGVVLTETDPSHRLANPELSPDGQRVGVTRAVQNNIHVWLGDLVRGTFTRFTSDLAVNSFQLWSPDGSQIVFGSNRDGIASLFLKPSSGTGVERSLLVGPNAKFPQAWSRDGRFLLFMENDPKTGRDLLALPMTGADRKPRVVANTAFQERNGQFSPDGRWVAYETDESGLRFEIVVQPFPEASAKWQVSSSGGTQPRWRADGKEIYFIAPDRKLMAASVLIRERNNPVFTAGTPEVLFPTRIGDGGASTFKAQYAVSRDGRFLVNQPPDDSTAPVTLILNWKPLTP